MQDTMSDADTDLLIKEATSKIDWRMWTDTNNGVLISEHILHSLLLLQYCSTIKGNDVILKY